MVNQSLMDRSLLSVNDLSLSETKKIFERAESFRPLFESGKNATTLTGKTVVNLFVENSTRTRSSFEIAARRLGGSVLNIAVSESSLKKGETLIDTAKNIEAMMAHVLVMRHACAGAGHFLLRHLSIPIINAGDGFHEHPTQALLDVFTIRNKFGEKKLKGLKVLIIGDIAHSRVARSNIALMNALGMSVTVCGPPTLLPPQVDVLGVKSVMRPEEALPHVDVVMTLRIQFERQNKMQIPSVGEYAEFWGINKKRASMMPAHAILMHPGPINRGVELANDVADSDASVILDQVTNGVLVRMAVLERSMGDLAHGK